MFLDDKVRQTFIRIVPFMAPSSHPEELDDDECGWLTGSHLLARKLRLAGWACKWTQCHWTSKQTPTHSVALLHPCRPLRYSNLNKQRHQRRRIRGKRGRTRCESYNQWGNELPRRGLQYTNSCGLAVGQLTMLTGRLQIPDATNAVAHTRRRTAAKTVLYSQPLDLWRLFPRSNSADGAHGETDKTSWLEGRLRASREAVTSQSPPSLPFVERA